MSHQVQLSPAASHRPTAVLDPARHATEPPACRSRCPYSPAGNAPDTVPPWKSDLHGHLSHALGAGGAAPGRWPAGPAARGPGGPAAADDDVAVPAHDRVRGNQQPQPLAPRLRYDAEQGSEQGPVRPIQLSAAAAADAAAR